MEYFALLRAFDGYNITYVELLGAIWMFGTLLVIAHAMDTVTGPEGKYYSSLWCYLFPVTWILFKIKIFN